MKAGVKNTDDMLSSERIKKLLTAYPHCLRLRTQIQVLLGVCKISSHILKRIGSSRTVKSLRLMIYLRSTCAKPEGAKGVVQ